jgi:hypothetical protein
MKKLLPNKAACGGETRPDYFSEPYPARPRGGRLFLSGLD